MFPTILGSVFLAVFLYHLPKTVGYDVELKSDGFYKFQDVSRVKYTTLEVKTEQDIIFSFFNDNERLDVIGIKAGRWKWGPLGGDSPTYTQMSSVEFTKYWFSWYGDVVQFGRGVVPGVQVIGTRNGIPDTVQYKYTSTSITDPYYNATIRFPDSSVFRGKRGTRLNVPDSIETTSTLLACGFKCLSQPMCFAFNYKVNEISNNNCELHGLKTITNSGVTPTPFHTVPNSDWNYYFLL